MGRFLENPKMPLKYSPMMREYHIPFTSDSRGETITYCPWCGTKLPESVRDQYFEILWAKGIEPGVDKYNDPTIPTEFKSEEWWKKRGL
jgi:hypothetical protein